MIEGYGWRNRISSQEQHLKTGKETYKQKIVGCKWIYKIKKGMTVTEPSRFKTRLVTKGYT